MEQDITVNTISRKENRWSDELIVDDWAVVLFVDRTPNL
jgi:hypothetical protein